MIKMTMEYGHCEDSLTGLLSFSNALIYMLEDINEGYNWGRMALSLMKEYEKSAILNATLYGKVLIWKGEC